MGDFLKNAGIVGLNYLLEISEAKKGIDYGFTSDEQSIWIDRDFAISAEWTDLYFKTAIKCYGKSTVYQRIIDKIVSCKNKIDQGTWKLDKEQKDDLKYINDKLFSKSYQNGFECIKDKIENADTYCKFKKDKLEKQVLRQQLEELEKFLKQPLCKETFAMKSIIYTNINQFWDGKSFLLSTNAKKDIKEVFEKDFSTPLKKYIGADHTKAKDFCIDCGRGIKGKEKISITFMNGRKGDLNRKKNDYFGYKANAFLCPLCAFIYALSPFGFQLYADKYTFININDTIATLIEANNRDRSISFQKKDEKQKYAVWFAKALNAISKEKTKELHNIPIIIRKTTENENIKYMFEIIHSDVLKVLSENKVQKALEYLETHPYAQISNDSINIHEEAIENILKYKNQYSLLNRILRQIISSKDKTGLIVTAYWIYIIQVSTSMCVKKEVKIMSIKDQNERQEMAMIWETEKKRMYWNRQHMIDSGYELRKAILAAKKTDDDECIRGIMYQLVNALSVKNEEKFMEIIFRLYISTKLLMPDGFRYITDDFSEYAYAFVMGLKGCGHEKEKRNNQTKINNKEGEHNE